MGQRKIMTLDDNLKNAESQFVTFTLSSETYGVKVTDVQEIIGMTPVTHVPNSPEFMRGVISLRGMVVPVLDMRLVLKMKERAYDAFNVIIIVEANSRLVGMIVDSVSDVSNVQASSIQETPQFSGKIGTEYIEGIGRIGETLIIFLNVNKIAAENTIPEISDSLADLLNNKGRIVNPAERI